MKKNIILVVTLIIGTTVFAQENEQLNRFVEKYSARGISGPMEGDRQKQVGEPMPDFYFNKELNLKSLKGKCVILDFWATWCGGCLLLSRDLDSLMIETTDVYKNVQIIGVNSQESRINKGYNARDYWKKTGKRFPMVDGPAADSCGKSVNNGFPTAILLDDKGIIRGRWDAWTALTANAVRVVAWKYAVYPGVKNLAVTEDNAKLLMKKKDWISALYFLENMPVNDSVMVMKMETMFHISEDNAASHVKELLEEVKGKPQYFYLAARVLNSIIANQTLNESLIQSGIAIAQDLRKRPEYVNDFSFQRNIAELHWRRAQIERTTAIMKIEQSISMAEQKGAAAREIESLKKLKAEFQGKE